MITRALLILAGIIASMSAGVETASGENRWHPTGPDGGEVRAIAAAPLDPMVLYAAARQTVFRSENGGASWSSTSWYIKAPRAVAVHPLDPAILFVGSGSGLSRSDDFGATWSGNLLGVPVPSIASVVVTPEGVGLAVGRRVFRSLDGGQNWQEVSAGLPGSSQYFSVASDPGSTSRFWLGSRSGIFRTDDHGATWTMVAFGDKRVRAVAVAVSPEQAVLAGVDGVGVVRSTDGGASWENVSGLPVAEVRQIAVDPANPGVTWVALALAGNSLHRSTDGGVNWEAVPVTSENLIVAALLLPAAADVPMLVAVGSRGLFGSLDQGVSWQEFNRGLSSSMVHSLLLDPGVPGKAYARTHAGWFASDDHLQSWRHLSEIPEGWLALDPATPGRLFVHVTGEGVFESLDSGATWVQVSSFSGYDVKAFFAHPASPGMWFLVFQDQMFRSLDACRTWTPGPPLPTHRVNSVVPTPAGDLLLWSVIGSGSEVFQSHDFGDSWSAPSAVEGQILDLVVSRSDPQHVLATVYFSNPWRSIDGGTIWSPMPFGLPLAEVWRLAFDPHDENVLYGASMWEGVVTSRDGGTSWHAINRGLPSGAANFPVLHPSVPGRVYLGTDGFGVAIMNQAGPEISGIEPSAGLATGGAQVEISGRFLEDTHAVRFGTEEAEFLVVSDSMVRAISPPQEPGTVHVVVLSPFGTSEPTAGTSFTYFPAVPPSIDSVEPDRGPVSGGTRVTVRGAGLFSTSRVDFGSVPGDDLDVLDDETARVTSPAAAGSGPVTVTVFAETGISPPGPGALFHYLETEAIPAAGTIALLVLAALVTLLGVARLRRV